MRRNLIHRLVLTGVGGAVGLVASLISCSTLQRTVVAPPTIPGATYVGMETCGACHEKQVKDFKLASHSRLTLRTPAGDEVEGLACEACHGAGSLHVDAGGGKGKFVVNTGQMAEACYECHLEKRAEFSLPYHHPIKEGRMNCLACHDVHGADTLKPKGLFVGRDNDGCATCHREQARPRVFEHEAMREGCTVCHNAHGSINDKLLTERDNNLCLKCHAQVVAPAAPAGSVQIGAFPHAGIPPQLLRQGNCYSAGCHTAVHGSDVNSHLRY